MPNESKEQKEKLLKLVRDALQQDNELREKYQIGEKFRFIRDRLQALLSRAEESVTTLQKKVEQTTEQLAADEVLVYVYIFNAQGLVLQTWQKMLNPSVFYEHSVNRPVYTDKSNIEAFIRTKPTKAQHGYLTIAVKSADILPASVEQLKDPIGNPIFKVREGSLRANRMISFTQNGNEYTLGEGSELIKKKS
jgi:hypothetical protein